jgi:hypothetical protein
LIRGLIRNPQKDGMRFIASEFVLYEFGRKRVDVFAYENGVLYDIELKNMRRTKVVTQTVEYIDHIRDRLSKFEECLSEFPNSTIGKITDVRGIALVPHSDKSIGKLENECKEKKIGLSTFDRDDNYRIQTIIPPGIV